MYDYTYLLSEAFQLAAEAHGNQLDKSGKPYIWHPIRVAQQLTDIKAQIVALLHDVVEDTTVTLGSIEYGFPDEISEAVDAITRRVDETHMEYIKRCAKNKLARKVKLADLADNMSPVRLEELNENVRTGLMKRYVKARNYILSLED